MEGIWDGRDGKGWKGTERKGKGGTEREDGWDKSISGVSSMDGWVEGIVHLVFHLYFENICPLFDLVLKMEKIICYYHFYGMEACIYKRGRGGGKSITGDRYKMSRNLYIRERKGKNSSRHRSCRLLNEGFLS
jgi:hypothetical protein